MLVVKNIEYKKIHGMCIIRIESVLFLIICYCLITNKYTSYNKSQRDAVFLKFIF